MERKLRVGFVPGLDRWWATQRLTLKYVKMRLEGVVYPDVYCIPYYFADSFEFIQQGAEVPPGRFDLLLSELQANLSQLKYLESLVRQGTPPVAVITGPPEILFRDMTNEKLKLVQRILHDAPYVWAYSEEMRSFADGLIGTPRAEVIPWPFDYATTVRLGGRSRTPSDRVKVVLQVPLRFCGVTQNYPFVLKAVLLEVWKDLPAEVRERLSFHTFVYTAEDAEKYASSGFASGLPIQLEEKKSYRRFISFLAGCDAVVNLTVSSILGRITYLAAALGKPGIFSTNSEMNELLYPDSLAAVLDTQRMYELLRDLLVGLSDGHLSPTFLPRTDTAEKIGDISANTARMRALVNEGQPCAAL